MYSISLQVFLGTQMTSGTHWKGCETRVQPQQLLLCLPYKFFYIFSIIFIYFSQVLKHKNRDKCDPNKGLMNTKEAMCCAVLSHCSLPKVTAARQVPLSMEFSRQEYWSGLPCPPPGDHSDPRVEPFTSATWEALYNIQLNY